MRKYFFALLGLVIALLLAGAVYAQQPVNTSTFSGLPVAGTINGSELVPIDQNGITKRATTSQFLLGSVVLGTSAGGTGLYSVGPNGTCLQSNGTSLMYGACGSGGTGTPGGMNGQLQWNNNNTFAGYSIGSGLVVTTVDGTSYLNSTSTGGVSPAGPLGAIQYNNNGSFGGYGLGYNLGVAGGNLNVDPAGSAGSIQTNADGNNFGSVALTSSTLLGAYLSATPTAIQVGSGLTLTTSGGLVYLNATGGGGSCPSTGIQEENGPCIIEENGPFIIEE